MMGTDSLDFNSILLENIKHDGYFELIIEQIVLICLVSPINKVHVFGSVFCLEQQREKGIMQSVLNAYNNFFYCNLNSNILVKKITFNVR